MTQKLSRLRSPLPMFQYLSGLFNHVQSNSGIRMYSMAGGRDAFEFEGKDTFQIGDKNVDIFDRKVKQHQRDRASLLMTKPDPLLKEVTERLLDRLEDCKKSFPIGLSLGGAGEHVRRQLTGRGGIKKLFVMDISKGMLEHTRQSISQEASHINTNTECIPLVGDEEFLPFSDGSLDVVISSLGLHWVNDLPGAMAQCRRALKPDGLFLAAMFGGETLRELRIACTVAQEEREGGISPRVSPLAQVRDAGNLLTRAGLALPTVDVDEFTVRYPSALEVVEHLRSMGESNAVKQRSPSLRKDTALATAAVYQAMFGAPDGSVPATFQVIYMVGWSPHESQQKPRSRGSASVSLKNIQKAFESRDEPPPTVLTDSSVDQSSFDKQKEKALKDGSKVNLPSGSWYKVD